MAQNVIDLIFLNDQAKIICIKRNLMQNLMKKVNLVINCCLSSSTLND